MGIHFLMLIRRGTQTCATHAPKRIVQYNFSGLKFLVRTETDGYVRESSAILQQSASDSATESLVNKALGMMAVSNNQVTGDQKLQLKIQGTRVSQQQIFDIKTRASYRPFDMDEILPRLWLNQTSKFLVAYHTFGLFDHPEVKDVRQDVLQWEKGNSAYLARFHAVVQRILDVVRDSENPQCEVSWDGEGPLRITKQIGEGRRALPPDLVTLLESS